MPSAYNYCQVIVKGRCPPGGNGAVGVAYKHSLWCATSICLQISQPHGVCRCFAGSRNSGVSLTNDLFEFVLNRDASSLTGTWFSRHRGGAPEARYLAAGVVADDSLWIIGGQFALSILSLSPFHTCAGQAANNRVLNDISVYSFSTDTWRAQPVLPGHPEPRYAHSAGVVGNKIVVAGGIGINKQSRYDIMMLDLKPTRR